MLLAQDSSIFEMYDRERGWLLGASRKFWKLTSTYFEGEMEQNPKAKRGYSRDQRPDCLQLVIPAKIPTPETRIALIEALRMAEVEYEHDEVFCALSPGARIESSEWDSGGPMSGVYKKARIPTSERKQAIGTLETIVTSLRTFWASRQNL